MMLGRIVYCNNVSVEPWSRVRPRKGLGETDRVRSDDGCDDDDLVGMIFFMLSCFGSCFCSVVLVLVVIAVIFYGGIIIASIQFCNPTYLIRIHFCTLVSASHYLS